MNWSGQIVIAGAFESPRRKAPDVHPYTIQAECIQAALEESGLTVADVDGFCTATGLPGDPVALLKSTGAMTNANSSAKASRSRRSGTWTPWRTEDQ